MSKTIELKINVDFPNGISDETKANLLRQEADRLEQKKPEPWKGGEEDKWRVFGFTDEGYPNSLYVESDGAIVNDELAAFMRYPTEESAIAAAKHLWHFARLCRLATDVNECGRAGGDFGIWYNPSRNEWGGLDLPRSHFYPDNVFESEVAALKACKIANRDGWKPVEL